MEKKVEISILWQIYGKMLTDKQYEYMTTTTTKTYLYQKLQKSMR